MGKDHQAKLKQKLKAADSAVDSAEDRLDIASTVLDVAEKVLSVGQAIPVLGGVCTVVKGERFCFRPKITFPKKKHSNRLLRKQVLLYSFPSRSLPASDMQGS